MHFLFIFLLILQISAQNISWLLLSEDLLSIYQSISINVSVCILPLILHKSRSDGVGTVTQEEKEKFAEIKERLRVQLEYQLTNFRFCFPFGRPEGALKSTLSLLERVNKYYLPDLF